MRAIFNRLRRLETASAPHERTRAPAETIMEARRRRLGAAYKPPSFPPEIHDGCRMSADRINRARELLMARHATEAMHRGHGPRPE
jgi:hypothetical protein